MQLKPGQQFLTRRAILATLAASGLGPLVWRSSPAQNAQKVKRLVLCFQPNGVIMDKWRPSGGTPTGAPLGVLSRSLVSFEPVKNKISVITGLDMNGNGQDEHQQGMGGLWTGSTMVPEGELAKPAGENAALANGASLDQVVAQAHAGVTRFSSLQFSVDRTSTGGLGPGWMTNTYSGPSQPLVGENDPYKMFDRIFQGFLGNDQATLAQLRAEQKSVLDRVSADLTRLSSVLGKTDREKLDAHLGHVRSIERRLVDGGGLRVGCDPRVLDARLQDKKDVLANDNYPAMVRLQTDIAILALVCDLTRVVSLQYSHSVSGITFNWLGYQPPVTTLGETGHHAHSHEWETTQVSNDHLSDIDRWYAEQVAYLVTQLDAIPEGGGTLLDNSVVAWGNEITRGSHRFDDAPFLVAGGAGGALQMGKNFDLRGSHLRHNRLLVSLGRALDLPLTTFGTLDSGTGGLSGLES